MDQYALAGVILMKLESWNIPMPALLYSTLAHTNSLAIACISRTIHFQKIEAPATFG